jgi:hypothetical protein
MFDKPKFTGIRPHPYSSLLARNRSPRSNSSKMCAPTQKQSGANMVMRITAIPASHLDLSARLRLTTRTPDDVAGEQPVPSRGARQ